MLVGVLLSVVTEVYELVEVAVTDCVLVPVLVDVLLSLVTEV